MYRDLLFEKSLTVIPELQEGASAFKKEALDKYISLGGYLIANIHILIYLIIE